MSEPLFLSRLIQVLDHIRRHCCTTPGVQNCKSNIVPPSLSLHYTAAPKKRKANSTGAYKSADFLSTFFKIPFSFLNDQASFVLFMKARKFITPLVVLYS